jgi:hypothetical protein
LNSDPTASSLLQGHREKSRFRKKEASPGVGTPINSLELLIDPGASIQLGVPRAQIIELLDCDPLLPDPDEVRLPERMNKLGARSSPYLYFCEMLKFRTGSPSDVAEEARNYTYPGSGYCTRTDT